MKLLTKRPHIFKIENKKGSLISFYPTKAQKALLELVKWQLENPSKNGKRKAGQVRINIPKSRQLGLSTMIKMLELSCGLENLGWNTFTVAHDLDSSQKIFRKIKLAFNLLPQPFKNLYIEHNNNQSNLAIGRNIDSSDPRYNQISHLSTSTSGRGGTYQFLHISELGMMSMIQDKWQETFSGTAPAVEQAKFVFYESTCDGGLGKYYDLTMAIQNGETEFDNLFLPWFWGEDYTTQAPENNKWIKDYKDLARVHELYNDPIKQFDITENQLFWYYNQVLKFKSTGQAEEIKTQYPFTLEEAFVAKAMNKFNISMVKNLKIREPISIKEGVKIFRQPDYDQIYSIGVDASSGLGADYTGISIRGLKKIDGKHPVYAQAKVKLQTKATAFAVINLFNWLSSFGRAYITPERNNMGDTIVNYLRDYVDERFIYSEMTKATDHKDKMVKKFGFATTSSNRSGADPFLVDSLASLFHDGLLEVCNIDQKNEMLNFIWNDDKRRYEARTGEHDDLLLADMMAIQGFTYIEKHG